MGWPKRSLYPFPIPLRGQSSFYLQHVSFTQSWHFSSSDRYSPHILYLASVFHSISITRCCNKLPQNWWLRKTQISSLTVLVWLEVWSQSDSKTTFPPETLRENPLLPLPVFSGSRHSLACGSITPISTSIIHMVFSSLSPSVSPFLFILTLIIRFRAHRNPRWSHVKILTFITSTKILRWTYIWEDTIQPPYSNQAPSCISTHFSYEWSSWFVLWFF